jgi:hypothetical protein
MLGIIKRWNPEKRWGIIYCPDDLRFFLHGSKIIQGTPELFAQVEFDIAPARHPAELPPAVNVKVRAVVPAARHDVKVVRS